ncbi:MAG: M56 family metallopeptidase [Bacteroidota bacterium]
MTDIIIYSTGMALLHSLWQILIIYSLLRMLLKLFQNATSSIRYSISLGAMASVLLMGMITFGVYFSGEKEKLESLTGIIEDIRQRGYSFKEISITAHTEASEGWAWNYLPYIVLIYFSGLIFMSLRLIFSILYLKKYKTRGIKRPEIQLENCFTGLIKRFHINKNIRLLESFLVKTPMVIGYFKPLVVVPVGIFTQLPFNQIEAILAHELAHIKRNDFLINIIQSVVELLFFYHPVIYLISKHIREERENCCDDIALSQCSDSSQYLKALALVEGIMPTSPRHAVAFVKQKPNLFNRMKRILNPKTMKTKLSDRIIAGIIILAGFSVLMLTGAAALHNISGEQNPLMENTPNSNFSSSLSLSASTNDTIISYDNNRIITYRKNEKGEKEKIEMEFENGKPSELIIDGKTIPEKDYKHYKNLVLEIRQDVSRASKEVEKAEKERERIDEEKIEREIEAALRELETIDKEKIEKELQRTRAEIEEIDAEEIRREVEFALKEAEIALEEAQLEINMDGISRELQKAMESIDWEEIRQSVHEAMEEAGMNQQDMEKIRKKVDKAMKGVNWDEINESIYLGMEAAKTGIEVIPWDIINHSIDMSLDITEDVLQGIAVGMERSSDELNRIEQRDVKAEFHNAHKQAKEEKENLDELEKNLEKALEELETK